MGFKKFTFLLCIGVFSWCQVEAQCPTGDIILSNQAQVDSFPLAYPGCHRLSGGLEIYGADIISLDSLIQLDYVEDNLRILYNDSLQSLSGLNNIDSVIGYVQFYANNSLIDLEGLNSLNYVGSNFNIDANTSLDNLTGLESLETIWGMLWISGSSIQSLDGLEHLEYLGEGNIGGPLDANDNLTTLNGLQGLDTIHGDFSIDKCPQLEDVSALSSLKVIEGRLDIDDCPSLESLASLDSLKSVKGLSISNTGLINLSGLEGIESTIEYISVAENTALQNLDGLSNLKNVGTMLRLSHNDKLQSLAGLGAIESVGAGTTGRIELYDNDALTSLNGIGDIDSLHQLRIIGNSSLTSLNDFPMVNYIKRVEIGSNSSLSNIDGISNAGEIGSLEIGHNVSLLALPQDFNPLKASSSLSIYYNESLLDYDGLNTLTELKNLRIFGQSHLENIEFLSKLEKVNNLSIYKTDVQSFSGLKALKIIDTELYIWENENLTSLTGLDSISNLDKLQITSNSILNQCAVEGICTFIQINPDSAWISSNAEHCNDNAEILDDCASLAISDRVENEDFMSIWPNPAMNEISVVNLDQEASGSHVKILNLSGNIVKEVILNSVGVIDVHDLVPGMYFLKMQKSSRPHFSARFVKL